MATVEEIKASEDMVALFKATMEQNQMLCKTIEVSSIAIILFVLLRQPGYIPVFGNPCAVPGAESNWRHYVKG